MDSARKSGYWMGLMAVAGACAGGSMGYAAPVALVTTQLNGDLVLIGNGDTVDLGEIAVGEDTNFQFQVQNQGDGLLSLNSLDASNSDGNVTINSAGFSSVFNQFACGVVFTADRAGTLEFSVTINTNDASSPLSFAVRALGTAPQFLLTNGLFVVSAESPLEIEAVEVGQTGGEAPVARNIGNETLNFPVAAQVTDLTGGDAGDVTIVLPTLIQPGGFGVVTIAFEPTTAGLREFQVEIHSNDPNSPYVFNILAEGLAPEIEIVDCNLNGIDDADDLANGTHFDCDFDGLLDDCETDTDGDGLVDDCDECPGEDDLLDSDEDSVPDCLDNCPFEANSDQTDADFNGIGDECEAVEDLIEDCNENGIDDASDLAEGTEEDCNENEVPDSCELDIDNDDVIDECDLCPGEDDLTDGDNDGVADCLDNCLDVANFNQADDDGNGIGDACEVDINPVDPDDDDRIDLGASFCGAGAMAMIPMIGCGLCGLRATSRRRRAVVGV